MGGAGGNFPPGPSGSCEAGRSEREPVVVGRAGRVAAAPYLGSLLHVVLAEPAPAVHHQPVYQREEEVDGLAALLRAPDPLDLVAAEMPLGDAAAGAGQLPVGQLPVAVHPLHPLQHAVPHHLPQEVVQVAEADVVQAGHDVLQGDSLQVEPHDVPQRHGAAGTGAPLPCPAPASGGDAGRAAAGSRPSRARAPPPCGARRGEAKLSPRRAGLGWVGMRCAPRRCCRTPALLPPPEQCAGTSRGAVWERRPATPARFMGRGGRWPRAD